VPDDLVEVRIVGLPLEVYREAAEHQDGLLREFALLAESDRDRAPARLLALGDEIRSRFSGFTAAPESTLAAALERGDASVDLVYRLPAEVGDASRRLGELLDEADEYCRQEQLLTLATPPRALAFRRWFLEEFVRQSGGGAPTPWPGTTGTAGTTV
jgi:hypothetical protein